jgi:hypothetical protein
MLKSRVPQADFRATNYGHFGIPFYDPILREWTFSKHGERTTTRFVQIGNVEQLAPATGTAVPTTYLRHTAEQTQRRYDRAMKREVRLLASMYPETQSAELTYAPLLRLSEGVAQALEEYDPAARELLDVGTLSWRTEEGRESLHLLALPGGECGEALRLSRLRGQDYSVERDRTFEVAQATEETGWWTGKGAPILQICFSHAVEDAGKDALLAVRLQGCIIFMFPRYRATPVPAPGIELGDPPKASRIDPNILFELYPAQMQGIRSADVAFNPWNHREFATIDQAGQWTTFTIVRQDEQFPVYEPEQLQKGRMPKVANEEEEEETRNEAEEVVAEVGGTEPPADAERGQSFDRETTTPPDIAGWAAGIPQIKTSASRHNSPSLESLPDASSDQQDDEESEKGNGARDASEATETAQAKMVDQGSPSGEDDEIPELRQDGWARITWTLNSNTLIVSSRKAIHVLDRTTGETFDLPRMLLVDTLAPGWYFDVKLCYDRPDHIFVLTSQSVFFIQIFEDLIHPEEEQDDEQTDVEQEPKRVPKVRIIASALHFRDTSDTSLRLHVSTEDCGYLAIVHSQWNKVMTSFRFEISRPSDKPPAVSEAMPLIIPEDAYGRALSLMVSQIRMHDDLDDMSIDRDSNNLYGVQFLGRDYALRQYFFENRGPELYTRATAPQRLAGYHRNQSTVQPRSTFIVPDHEEEEIVRQVDEDLDLEDGEDDDDEAVINGEDQSMTGETEDDATARSVLTSMIGYKPRQIAFFGAARAVAQNVNAEGEPLVPQIDMGALSTKIQEVVADHGTAQSWQKTVFEHIGLAVPVIGDLRDASYELEDAFSSSSALAAVKVKPQLLPISLGLDDDDLEDDDEEEEDNDMIPFDQMHAYLEENYVATLDEAFPIAFREQRERLAKSVAAEIILASARIEHKLKEEEPRDDDVEMDDQLVGSSQPLTRLSQATDLDEQSQQATPTTIGQFTISRQSPYRTPVDDTMLEITRRLEKNATIAIKPTQKWSLKAAVMLSHWELGADPEDYSYQETKERLEEEKKYVGLSEQEKRRLKRRQGRDQVRREREARKAQRLNDMSSQAPSILSSQLPGASASQSSEARPSQTSGMPAIRGSQQTPSSQVPGLGTPTATPARARKEKGIPGFGSQAERTTPARKKTVPGFGAESSQAGGKSRKEKRPTASQQESAGPSQSQSQSQAFATLADTAPLPTPSQTQAADAFQAVVGSQRSEIASSSQVTIEGSQMPMGSQSQRFSGHITGSQTPRKKKRKEGF